MFPKKEQMWSGTLQVHSIVPLASCAQLISTFFFLEKGYLLGTKKKIAVCSGYIWEISSLKN